MWILKKDIITPSFSVKAGTPGEKTQSQATGIIYRFPNSVGGYYVSYAYEMGRYPDFFEEVKDPEPKVLSVSDVVEFVYGAYKIGKQYVESDLKNFCKDKAININPTTNTQPDSEKKWSNEQLMSFVTYLVLDIPNAPTMERIENDFENWKKEKGYE